MIGIFVNCDEVDYADAIVHGNKFIETRSKDMLKDCVHNRVAIIRTRRGETPTIVGHAFITWKIFLPADYLDTIRNITHIPRGSKHDCKGTVKGKWCYHMENRTPCYPYPLPDNAVRHGRSWCEFEEV